jgi:PAS domain-containing protein
VLFIGIFALRESEPDVGDVTEILFVVPIALRFGLRGGLAGGLLGLALIAVWDHFDSDLTISVEGYLNRGIAFLLLGTLLGLFVDARHRLEAEFTRYFDASLDLLATADFTGWLTRVNPAWERTLGHSPETLCSRHFVEFLHPEDREATIA